jgi:CheY-like chemotaxis protein/HPt (histidine-containing phosphotransfer) domain-containing protein
VNPLSRTLPAALIAGVLIGLVALAAGEWRLRGQATELAGGLAVRAGQALRNSDELALARMFQEAAAAEPSLATARLVAPDGETLARLTSDAARRSPMAALQIAVPVRLPGRAEAATLSMTHSRAPLLATALITALVGAAAVLLSRLVASLRSRILDGGARRPVPPEAPSEPDTTAAPLAGLSILIADDSEISRRLLSLYVSRHGGRSEQVSDGQQAVERAVAEHYDCIVLDLRMPRLDGPNVARYLKAQGLRVPIVAVTAQSETGLGRAEGFDAALIKPVAESDLVEVLQCLCAAQSAPATPPAPAPSEPTDPGGPDMVWDRRRALQQAGGNASLAAELFGMLRRELEEQRGRLGDPETDPDALREMAHKLRASARYCAAPELESRATQLEQALLDDAGVEAIESARLGLDRAIGAVLGLKPPI